MEVISTIDTDNWSQLHNCMNCDSKLKINIQDIIYVKELQGFYDIETDCYYVSCPICSKLSFIQEQDIPKLAQLEVKEIHQRDLKRSLFKKEQKSFIDKFLSLFD